MSDVCERAAVDDGRCMLQCLYKVRFQGILKECTHSTLCVQVAGCYRFLLGNFSVCITDDDPCKAVLQVCNVTCKAKDCHDLGCYCDVVAVFPRHAVCLSAKAVYYETELAVIHIHTSSPCDLPRVDVQSVALVDMVVDHCCKQVVCCTDCVEIACEMEVDVFHRYYLCVSAACCTALNAEYRSK